jgi:general secretion pathway protein A
MYESFFGLNMDPFRLSTDPRFCFNHPSYIRAKGSVQYALYRAEGFVMITGRPGTGKATLVGDLMASLPAKKYVIGHLVSSQLEGGAVAHGLLRLRIGCGKTAEGAPVDAVDGLSRRAYPAGRQRRPDAPATCAAFRPNPRSRRVCVTALKIRHSVPAIAADTGRRVTVP